MTKPKAPKRRPAKGPKAPRRKLDDALDSLSATIDRVPDVAALRARVAELEREVEKQTGLHQLDHSLADQWLRRAEAAEAKVKELERALARHGQTHHEWAERCREAREEAREANAHVGVLSARSAALEAALREVQSKATEFQGYGLYDLEQRLGHIQGIARAALASSPPPAEPGIQSKATGVFGPSPVGRNGLSGPDVERGVTAHGRSTLATEASASVALDRDPDCQALSEPDPRDPWGMRRFRSAQLARAFLEEPAEPGEAATEGAPITVTFTLEELHKRDEVIAEDERDAERAAIVELVRKTLAEWDGPNGDNEDVCVPLRDVLAAIEARGTAP